MKYLVSAKIIVAEQREVDSSDISEACNEVESDIRNDGELKRILGGRTFDVIITSIKEAE